MDAGTIDSDWIGSLARLTTKEVASDKMVADEISGVSWVGLALIVGASGKMEDENGFGATRFLGDSTILGSELAKTAGVDVTTFAEGVGDDEEKELDVGAGDKVIAAHAHWARVGGTSGPGSTAERSSPRFPTISGHCTSDIVAEHNSWPHSHNRRPS